MKGRPLLPPNGEREREKEFDAHVQITPFAVTVYNTDKLYLYNMVYNIFCFRFHVSVMIPFVVQMHQSNV